MQYIIFDLEFNQDIPSIKNIEGKQIKCPFEIIQIGAVKLDSDLNNVDSFNRLVKPMIYQYIPPYITELTGITMELLLFEESFPEICRDFTGFIGQQEDSVFCVWGMSDMKELFRNVEYHDLDRSLIPKSYINIQPYVSKHFGWPKTKPLKLQSAVEHLGIPIEKSFHDAYHDAFYTSEIFKKIYTPSITPKVYDPYFIPVRPKHVKNVVNYDKLLKQFEKMYARDMTEEEKGIIKLAYKMGKTRQFIE